MFALYGLAILAMFVAGIVYLAKGHHAVVNPWDFTAWKRQRARTGINFTNWTFFGLVVLALLGVEVPLNMGVEIREQRLGHPVPAVGLARRGGRLPARHLGGHGDRAGVQLGAASPPWPAWSASASAAWPGRSPR